MLLLPFPTLWRRHKNCYFRLVEVVILLQGRVISDTVLFGRDVRIDADSILCNHTPRKRRYFDQQGSISVQKLNRVFIAMLVNLSDEANVVLSETDD